MNNYSHNNQYSTSYSGQGAADGGGGFVSGDLQSSQTGGKGEYDNKSLRPVTVKQILEAQEVSSANNQFKIDGEMVSQVTFVGQIRAINTLETHITYQVDDGTGIIDAKFWRISGGDQDQMDMDSNSNKLVEDGYGRVYGSIKAFQDKRHVYVHVIRPIADYNEVNYHLLEATAVHLFFTRGPPPDGDRNGHVKSDAQHNTAGGQQDTGPNGKQLPSMSSSARRVYATLKDMPMNNEGMHVQMLASQLGMDVNEVYRGAEELVSLGVIFTTVDDNTWAVLDYY